MGGKEMEGDNRELRKKGLAARRQGKRPSEVGATTGASEQRKHLRGQEGHLEKLETIRQGKQASIQQGTPEPRPHSRRD